MIVIYQAEFWVVTLFTVYFFYLVLELYAYVSESVGPILFKFQKAFTTGDFSAITAEETAIFKAAMQGIPP